MISKNRIQEVIDRAKNGLRISTIEGWPLIIAIDTLSLGYGYFLQALNKNQIGFKKVDELLNQAVDGLRGSGEQDFLSLGLLARAELYRNQEKWGEAQEDLDEVFDLSKSSGMRLLECDAHLEQARLFLAQGKKDEAKSHVKKAQKLIEDTGYHRRDSALKELQEQIK